MGYDRKSTIQGFRVQSPERSLILQQSFNLWYKTRIPNTGGSVGVKKVYINKQKADTIKNACFWWCLLFNATIPRKNSDGMGRTERKSTSHRLKRQGAIFMAWYCKGFCGNLILMKSIHRFIVKLLYSLQFTKHQLALWLFLFSFYVFFDGISFKSFVIYYLYSFFFFL